MAKETENFSILDKNVTFEGTLSSKGKLIIRGTIKGSLIGETVVISEGGAVYADVKAGSVTVGGTFEGSLRAMNELIVLSSGNCQGKIVCKDLVIEPGGILNADVKCLKVQERQIHEELPLKSKVTEKEIGN